MLLFFFYQIFVVFLLILIDLLSAVYSACDVWYCVVGYPLFVVMLGFFFLFLFLFVLLSDIHRMTVDTFVVFSDISRASADACCFVRNALSCDIFVVVLSDDSYCVHARCCAVRLGQSAPRDWPSII